MFNAVSSGPDWIRECVGGEITDQSVKSVTENFIITIITVYVTFIGRQK